MQKAKKLFAVLCSVVMLISCMTAFAFASEMGTQDGLKAVIQTDKDIYASNEDIQITVTVTNNNTFEVKNVSIESLLPDALTLKDGDLKSDTVDLKPGETLSISYVAVLEKEEPTVTVTTEPVTETPTTTEPVSTTEPSSTAPATTEPSTVETTSIQPVETTTDAGAILPVEPSTAESTTGIIGGELTTVDNTLDNPETGSNSTIINVLLITLVAVAVVVATIIVAKKNNKKVTKIISLVLCGAIAVSSFATVGFIKVGAEENNTRCFTVDKAIMVEEENYTLNGIINYDRLHAVVGDVTLNGFSADIYDIYLDTETTVTFTVEVNSNTSIPAQSLGIYDDNNQFVVYMNDDGVNGDQIANDSIYTGQAILSSSEIGVVNYFASIGEVKSNSFEICFYRDLTQDEFIAFTKLLNTISALSFEDACVYVEESNEISTYFIDDENKIITYQSIYGIYGIWEEHSDSSIKGNGENAIAAENGLDYNAVDRVISSATIVPEIDNKDVIVLRPFRSSDFQYDDFKTTGELLAKSLGGNVTVIDDGAVTVSVMKSLASYGTVLIDSHGTLNFFKTPYMVIGEELNEGRFLWDPIYYLQHASYSADYLSGRIYCTGYRDRLAIGGKFFEKYYSTGSLAGSYWFLGTCYSMYNNSIADALTNKGASAVVGFTDTVSTNYCNATLFEITLNSMLLSADTVRNSVQCAKDIYGEVDPNNSSCELKLKGNNLFKLVTSISTNTGSLSGKICKASDHSTPVGGATISIYKENNLIRTFTADDAGNYTVNLPVGSYRFEITSDGYITFDAYATVTANDNTYMETFLLVAGEEGQTGIATGKVKNALTGNGISDVQLSIRKGWNNASFGEVVSTVTTNENGDYTLNLPFGNYTVYATKDGYISNTFNIIIQQGTTSNQDGTITPAISGDNYRIVLTWDENPRDLDSHVEGKLENGGSFHVYYGHKSQYDGEIEVCNLDVDDTTSYGPETITLNTTSDVPYYYYIKRYAGSGTVGTSGAQINVYQGENLVATFNVPTDQGDGDYWNVFAIVNGELIVQNTITSSKDTSYANVE